MLIVEARRSTVLYVEESQQKFHSHVVKLLPQKEQSCYSHKSQPVDHGILTKSSYYSAELQHFRIEFELLTQSVAGDLHLVYSIAFQVAVFGFDCFEVESFEQAND